MSPESPPAPPSPRTAGRGVRRGVRAALLLVAATATACNVECRRGTEIVRAGDSSTTASAAPATAMADSQRQHDSAMRDSLAALPPVAPDALAADSLRGDATRRGPALDSLTALGTAEDSAAGEVSRTGPVDSTTVAPSPAELATLDAALAIPVSGVRADELVDSYDDARGSRVHQAMDILAPRGTPVVSATDGRVVKLFTSRAGGLMLYATDASERFILLYGHLDRYADGVREGMPLKRGALLGYVGSTGNASPEVPHLHFGIARTADPRRWWGGTPVNPYPLLK